MCSRIILFVSALICLLTSAAILPAFAVDEWSLLCKAGQWIYSDRMHWQSYLGGEDAFIIYKYNHSQPLTYWILYIEGGITREGICDVRNLFNITLAYSTDRICIVAGWNDMWHPPSSSVIPRTILWLSDNNTHTQLNSYGGAGGFIPERLVLERTGNTTLRVRWWSFQTRDASNYLEYVDYNYTLTEDFLDNTEIYLTLYKDVTIGESGSKGQIYGNIYNEILNCTGGTVTDILSEHPEIPEMTEIPFWDRIGLAIWGAITGATNYVNEAIRNIPYLGFIYDSLVFCFTFVGGIIWSFVNTGLPFLPLILVFWVLDAIITSVTTGNLQPIGNVFLSIYDFIRGVVQTIANIVSTIWDYVTFWS